MDTQVKPSSKMSRQPTVFSRETLLPIGFTIILVTVAWTLSRKLTMMDSRLERIEGLLAGVKTFDDRWTGTQMQGWAALLQAQNPTMVVPEVP